MSFFFEVMWNNVEQSVKYMQSVTRMKEILHTNNFQTYCPSIQTLQQLISHFITLIKPDIIVLSPQNDPHRGFCVTELVQSTEIDYQKPKREVGLKPLLWGGFGVSVSSSNGHSTVLVIKNQNITCFRSIYYEFYFKNKHSLVKHTQFDQMMRVCDRRVICCWCTQWYVWL